MILKPILADLLLYLKRYWVGVTAVAAVGIWGAILTWPRRGVVVIFCDAGQGDEILIQKGFTQILIDGSRPGKSLDCLFRHLPAGDRSIEMMVTTHPEIDHYGGLTNVLLSFNVISFVYNGQAGKGEEWARFSRQVIAEGAKIEAVREGDRLRTGELELAVLWPPRDTASGSSVLGVLGVQSHRPANENSLVLWLRYGDFDALLTGDIGQETETVLATKGSTLKGGTFSDLEVLKVAHHGSKFSSSEPFLRVLNPTYAVIEVGRNSYGHPAVEVLERLKAVGARIFRTDQDGDVVVRTDGKKWKVKASRK